MYSEHILNIFTLFNVRISFKKIKRFGVYKLTKQVKNIYIYIYIYITTQWKNIKER